MNLEPEILLRFGATWMTRVTWVTRWINGRKENMEEEEAGDEEEEETRRRNRRGLTGGHVHQRQYKMSS